MKKFLPGSETAKNNVGNTVVKAKDDIKKEAERFFKRGIRF